MLVLIFVRFMGRHVTCVVTLLKMEQGFWSLEKMYVSLFEAKIIKIIY